MTAIPKPCDPRTPLQQVSDQLTAARQQLLGGSLSRSQRQVLANRIGGLEQEAQRLQQ
ncbi:hypothetical protein ACFV3E_36740 [Streptomyces sp. NPDC059718]